MSQWAVSNKAGEYSVAVPYGEYRVDGYELDSISSNNVLAGLIEAPFTSFSRRGTFSVTDKQSGNGLDFTFVKPIIKTIKVKQFTLNEPITISWKPYADASSYRVQIYERSKPNEYINGKELFDWESRPRVKGTSIDIKSFTSEFKAGHYYSYYISAYDKDNKQLSESKRTYNDYDFKIN